MYFNRPDCGCRPLNVHVAFCGALAHFRKRACLASLLLPSQGELRSAAVLTLTHTAGMELQLQQATKPGVLPSAKAACLPRCRRAHSARQGRRHSLICKAAIASPSKQGTADRHCVVQSFGSNICKSRAVSTCTHAERQVFQHDGPLDEIDSEVAQLIKHEKGRQVRSTLHARRKLWCSHWLLVDAMA